MHRPAPCRNVQVTLHVKAFVRLLVIIALNPPSAIAPLENQTTFKHAKHSTHRSCSLSPGHRSHSGICFLGCLVVRHNLAQSCGFRVLWLPGILGHLCRCGRYACLLHHSPDQAPATIVGRSVKVHRKVHRSVQQLTRRASGLAYGQPLTLFVRRHNFYRLHATHGVPHHEH